MRRYRISGGDDGAYGPAFGPVRGAEVGPVAGAAPGLLVRLSEPLQLRNETIEYLVLRPRYDNQSVAEIGRAGGIVGIWRVRPGYAATVTEGLTPGNAEYWAVGRCQPIAN